MDHPFKQLFDWFIMPITLITGYIFQWLPVAGFLVPVIYYSIQIYESKTFQQYRHSANNRKTARIAARILRLKAQIVAREGAWRQAASVAKVVAASQASQAAQVSQLAQVPDGVKTVANGVTGSTGNTGPAS